MYIENILNDTGIRFKANKVLFHNCERFFDVHQLFNRKTTLFLLFSVVIKIAKNDYGYLAWERFRVFDFQIKTYQKKINGIFCKLQPTKGKCRSDDFII